MKNLILVSALIIAFAACSNENKTEESQINGQDSFEWKQYKYPVDQIGKGKTFAYRNVQTKYADVFNDIQLTDEAGEQYVVSKLRSLGFQYDFIKTTVDGRVVESYMYISLSATRNIALRPPLDSTGSKYIQYDSFSKPLKGEILEDTLIDTGKKIKKSINKVAYAEEDSTMTYNVEEEYLKDTVITWQGKEYDCVVTTVKRTIEFSGKRYPNLKNTISDSGIYYYAKGIGLIRYINDINHKTAVIELVEIRDYSSTNKIMP